MKSLFASRILTRVIVVVPLALGLAYYLTNANSVSKPAAELPPPQPNSRPLSLPDPQSFNWPRIYKMAAHFAETHPDKPEWKEIAAFASNQLPPAPRLPQSPSHLPPADQARLRDLSHRVGRYTALPADERAAQTAQLLPDVKRFASEFPDLPAAWLLQAQLSVLADNALAGRIAGDNLVALHAWQTTRPEVLGLFAALLARDWIPLIGLPDPDAAALRALIAELTPADGATPSDEAVSAVFKRLKAFNRDHPLQPYGWVLQYDLAGRLDRPADQSVALARLNPPKTSSVDKK